jgi:hypothetical protein
VLEAIIAAFILFLFVLSATTMGGPDTDRQSRTIHEQTYNTLQTLDRNGSLRPAALDHDLTIRSMIAQYTPERNVEVAILALNATTRNPTFTGQHTASFTVTDAVEQEQLRVWYRDATAPNISVNGNAVENTTGTLQDEYTALDITDATTIGSNTLQIDTVGAATVGYSIEQYVQRQTGAAPANRDVFTTSYMVSGGNTTFAPVEVTVISWY